MIKNIVFDLGRVLVDFEPITYLERFGFDNNVNRELANIIFYGKEWLDCDRGVYSKNTEIVEILCEKHQKYQEEIRKVLTDEWVDILILKQETVNFLKKLKQKKYKIFLLSNISKQGLRYISNYEFFNLVDGGVYSYEIHACKPEYQAYQALLSKYKILPEETIFIDDNEDNIQAANEMKIHGITFNNLEAVKEKVEQIVNNNK